MAELLCAIPLLSALLSGCAPAPLQVSGYAEGEYVLIAPLTTAEVVELSVARGDRVTAGARLARVEHEDARIALTAAEAALARSRGRLADLSRGRRPEEIAVLQAACDSARAEAEKTGREIVRQRDLLRRGATSRTQFDTALAADRVARARVAEADAQLTVARLPAREQQIAAARAAVNEAAAARDAAAWQLARRTLHAPRAGSVQDVIRRVGEIAGPSAPVLSLLPDDAIKLRFYAPQAALTSIRPGSRLNVVCDGCMDTTATVTYVADGPEFTPPVIYSPRNRQKLVWLVEARPDQEAHALRPGQIVDVLLPP